MSEKDIHNSIEITNLTINIRDIDEVIEYDLRREVGYRYDSLSLLYKGDNWSRNLIGEDALTIEDDENSIVIFNEKIRVDIDYSLEEQLLTLLLMRRRLKDDKFNMSYFKENDRDFIEI